MSIEFLCTGCGRLLRVEDALAGRKTRCPRCDAVSVVSEAAAPVAAIRAGPAATAVVDGLPADTDEAAAVCPGCQADLLPGAVVCLECGYHLKDGKRLRTVRKPLARHWDIGLTPGQQLIGLAAVLAGTAVAVLRGWQRRGRVEWWWLLGFAAFYALITVGWTARITLERDRQGRLRLTKRRWVCFVPLSRWSVPVSKYQCVRLDYSAGEDTEFYSLELAGDHGQSPVTVYQGSNEEVMKDLADALRGLAGLRIERK
jgi:hypothetical protein